MESARTLSQNPGRRLVQRLSAALKPDPVCSFFWFDEGKHAKLQGLMTDIVRSSDLEISSLQQYVSEAALADLIAAANRPEFSLRLCVEVCCVDTPLLLEVDPLGAADVLTQCGLTVLGEALTALVLDGWQPPPASMCTAGTLRVMLHRAMVRLHSALPQARMQMQQCARHRNSGFPQTTQGRGALELARFLTAPSRPKCVPAVFTLARLPVNSSSKTNCAARRVG